MLFLSAFLFNCSISQFVSQFILLSHNFYPIRPKIHFPLQSELIGIKELPIFLWSIKWLNLLMKHQFIKLWLRLWNYESNHDQFVTIREFSFLVNFCRIILWAEANFMKWLRFTENHPKSSVKGKTFNFIMNCAVFFPSRAHQV